MADFATARRNMVDTQIRTNRVSDDRIVAAMGEIPREQFIQKQFESMAYVDEDVPIGNGRYLMEPMVLARLILALDLKPDDVVLDVGCATGYSSAVLSRLASTVVALESDEELVRQATQNLGTLGGDNVVVIEGSLQEGYPQQAPYDAILIDGAVAAMPDRIADQLSDGGRMCVIVTDGGAVGKATLVMRKDDVLSHRILFDANVPTLTGFAARSGFEF